MSVIPQLMVGLLALLGAFFAVSCVWEHLVRHRLLRESSAELTIYGDGCAPSAEHLIRAAVRIRRQYLPGCAITFVDIGTGEGQNIARHLAIRNDILYLR